VIASIGLLWSGKVGEADDDDDDDDEVLGGAIVGSL
jgi:nitrogen fixation-related uncharacterized protein